MEDGEDDVPVDVPVDRGLFWYFQSVLRPSLPAQPHGLTLKLTGIREKSSMPQVRYAARNTASRQRMGSASRIIFFAVSITRANGRFLQRLK